ncbi:glycosyltransferase family 2 protein [Lacinutrix sp. MedPE-SW]|uniref:glycosyltransferase family 2 protein n=1 Tax=Lacinutrix sp. MedPE-SW TaxID=1860087 RepID=UPI000916AAE1|nr:glycosyltransferase family 2 protein [Lacinutrix sp. MedPE-SW]OIQ17374.1 MAG: glycosyltransferase [Lacinutrix sp. MedPE-SW]
MKTPEKLSVIIPIFNESGIIDTLYARLVAAVTKITDNYEFVFVNDGSKDNSINEIKAIASQDEQVFFIDFSRNFGHQIAVSAGLKNVTGDSIVIIDGDLQDPPELIPELYKAYKSGFDVVYAKRKKRDGETWLKKTTSKWFYRTLSNITNFDIPLDTGDFRLISKKVVDALNTMPEQNKFIRAQIAWLGFKDTSVEFDRDSRKIGVTGYSYSRLIKMALDGITGFSDKPLLFVSRLGLIISLLSFAIILYALIAYFFFNQQVTGWTSLIVSTMFIGGIQLISVGVIGEYIARINTDVKKRPLYIVNETNIASAEVLDAN